MGKLLSDENTTTYKSCSGFYGHALLVALLKQFANSVTLSLHPFFISFVFFHPRSSGIIGICHALWFAWITNMSGEHYYPMVSTLIVLAACASVVLVAQFLSRANNKNEIYPERQILIITTAVAVTVMGVMSSQVPVNFVNIHLRTITFYFLVWMFETAQKSSKQFSVKMLSIIICFSALSVYLPLVAVIGIGAIISVMDHPDLVQTQAENFA